MLHTLRQGGRSRATQVRPVLHLTRTSPQIRKLPHYLRIRREGEAMYDPKEQHSRPRQRTERVS